MSGSRRPRGGPIPFDPTLDLFPSNARPPGVEPVAMADLSPFQRVLLVTDGTVTTFLEAWALEPVNVRRLWQRPLTLAGPDEALRADAGTPVLERAVMLSGATSASFFAYAESRIVPDRLPPAMRQALVEGEAGLGQILLAGGTDTRREGLWYGRERGARLPPEVAAVSDGEFLARSYVVSASGLPWMVITERFPWRPVVVGAGAGGRP